MATSQPAPKDADNGEVGPSTPLIHGQGGHGRSKAAVFTKPGKAATAKVLKLFNFDWKSFFPERNLTPEQKEARMNERRLHTLQLIENPFRESWVGHDRRRRKRAKQDLREQLEKNDANNAASSVANLSPEEAARRARLDEKAKAAALAAKKQEELPVQLLYDLFWVANVAAITEDKSFYDSHTLATYTLFTAILWFTWLQQAFHDLRYARDSFYERICKVIQFASLVVFVARSNEWDPARPEKSEAAIKYVTMTLLATRALLAVQYMVVLYWRLRTNAEAKEDGLEDELHEKWEPVFAHVLVMLTMTFVYGMLYLAFTRDSPAVRYWWLWFIFLLLEALAIVGASCRWNSVDFEGRVLVQRMGTLTMLVLGEGVIVIMKSVETVTNSATAWSADLGATIIAGLISVYLIWMFYFDSRPTKSKEKLEETSFQQHVWAVVHFPLHVAMLVYTETMRQYIVLWSFTDHFMELRRSISIFPERVQEGDKCEFVFSKAVDQEEVDKLQEWFRILNETKQAPTVLLNHRKDKALLDGWNATKALQHDILPGIEEFKFEDATEDSLAKIYRSRVAPVVWDIVNGFVEVFDIRTPDERVYERPEHELVGEVETTAKTGECSAFGVFTPEIVADASRGTYFVFRGIVVTLGTMFLILGVLAFLVRARHDPYDPVSIGVRLILAIIFFSFMGVTGTLNASQEATLHKLRSTAGKLIESPYLGIVFITIMFVGLLVQRLVDYWAFYRAEKVADHALLGHDKENAIPTKTSSSSPGPGSVARPASPILTTIKPTTSIDQHKLPAAGKNDPPLAGQGPLPASKNPSPASQSTSSAGQSSSLAGQSSLPAGQGPPPASQNPPSASQDPPSAVQSPSSASQSPLLASQGPSPTDQGLPLTGKVPSLAGQDPPPIGQDPSPADQQPLA